MKKHLIAIVILGAIVEAGFILLLIKPEGEVEPIVTGFP